MPKTNIKIETDPKASTKAAVSSAHADDEAVVEGLIRQLQTVSGMFSAHWVVSP